MTYKKGQIVWVCEEWDGTNNLRPKGDGSITAYYRECVVKSCGKKQMTLFDVRDDKFIGEYIYSRMYDTNPFEDSNYTMFVASDLDSAKEYCKQITKNAVDRLIDSNERYKAKGNSYLEGIYDFEALPKAEHRIGEHSELVKEVRAKHKK